MFAMCLRGGYQFESIVVVHLCFVCSMGIANTLSKWKETGISMPGHQAHAASSTAKYQKSLLRLLTILQFYLHYTA